MCMCVHACVSANAVLTRAAFMPDVMTLLLTDVVVVPSKCGVLFDADLSLRRSEAALTCVLLPPA